MNNMISIIRQKTELITVIGKTSKFLFGTMNTDDEQKIKIQIKSFSENKIQQNIS